MIVMVIIFKYSSDIMDVFVYGRGHIPYEANIEGNTSGERKNRLVEGEREEEEEKRKKKKKKNKGKNKNKNGKRRY